MQEKHPYKTDIAVLMLFFNRPQQFSQVFEQVRQARPSKLFLYQDGPRNGHDLEGISACRKIAENIDWDCKVYRSYQQDNQGCDPSGYLSQKWAFSHVDKCMVLEDDVVPAQSFFPFCKEMLDRYENDERIGMIAGYNIDEHTKDLDSDYFFSTAFSIWGWASWKRVIDLWDDKYTFLDDPLTVKRLKEIVKLRAYRKDFIPMCRNHRATGKAYHESISWSNMLLNNYLAIFPACNQISNIGATENSTHFSELKTMPKALRRTFEMKRMELTFPLRHPKYLMEYLPYKERQYKVNAWGHPFRKIRYSLEELYNNLLIGNFSAIKKALFKRIKKWLAVSYT